MIGKFPDRFLVADTDTDVCSSPRWESGVTSLAHPWAAVGLRCFHTAPGAPSLGDHTLQTSPGHFTQLSNAQIHAQQMNLQCWVFLGAGSPSTTTTSSTAVLRYRWDPWYCSSHCSQSLSAPRRGFCSPSCATSLVFLCDICTIPELKSHKESRFDVLPLIKSQAFEKPQKTVEKQNF